MTTQESLKHRLYKAKRIMEDNCHKQIKNEDIAREIGMSTYHFIRCFKQEFDLSPYQYVLHMRLVKASELLKKTALKATEISDISGFPDAQAFCKIFKKNFGSTPLDYRRAIPA